MYIEFFKNNQFLLLLFSFYSPPVQTCNVFIIISINHGKREKKVLRIFFAICVTHLDFNQRLKEIILYSVFGY